MPSGHQHSGRSQSLGTECLNLHALGEQWIEEVMEVDVVRTIPEGCPEGEHLKFKTHIRGWKAETRERRCQSLLRKTEHSLRNALLSAPWKESTVSVNCLKCKPQEGRTDTNSKRGDTKAPHGKRTAPTPDGSALRHPKRVQGQERVDYHEELESENQK